jgi:hypothetical protein
MPVALRGLPNLLRGIQTPRWKHLELEFKIVNSMRPEIRVPLLVVFLLAQRLVLLVT